DTYAALAPLLLAGTNTSRSPGRNRQTLQLYKASAYKGGRAKAGQLPAGHLSPARRPAAREEPCMQRVLATLPRRRLAARRAGTGSWPPLASNRNQFVSPS